MRSITGVKKEKELGKVPAVWTFLLKVMAQAPELKVFAGY